MSRVVGALIGLVVLVAGARGDNAAPKQGVLTLVNGNTLPGGFRPSDAPDVLRWQGASFTQPFEFVPSAISSVQFPAVQPPVRPQGEIAIETVGGDVLTGKITGWSPDAVAFDSAHFGAIQIRTDAIRRLYRLDDNPSLVFPGLLGLTGWRQSNSTWHEDGPHVWTDQDPALLIGDFDLPDRAVVEFELSWTKAPNFVFAIGVDPTVDADKRLDGWRFEAWNSILTVVREQSDVADVAAVQPLSKETRRVHLLAYLDQTTGKMQVFLPDGTAAGSVAVPPPLASDKDKKPAPRAGRGVRLVNQHGDVRLERLRIARWNGALPTPGVAGQARIELADGSLLSTTLAGFRPETQEFVILDGTNEQTIPARQLVAAEMSPAAQAGPRAVAAVLHDGTRISGRIDTVRGDELVVSGPDVTPAVAVRLAQLRSLTMLEKGTTPGAAASEGRAGRLEVGGHKLAGRLVAAVESADASCIAWQPEGSRSSSPLKPGEAGRVVYRDPPPPVPAATQTTTRVVQQQQGLNFANLFLKKAQQPAAPRPAAQAVPAAHSIHLRSGDVIPCTVLAITEEGVRISSPVADADLIPHAKIKALTLDKNAAPPQLKTAKKERLLTLPRLQQASPPTHLLYSRTGDYLRCRLLSMTDDQVVIELHLEEVQLPRDRVTQVIWFHPDELTAPVDATLPPPVPATTASGAIPPPVAPAVVAPPATVAAPAGSAGLAQVLQRDGNRVTFDPLEFDGTNLTGVSDVLGPVRFDVAGVDQVLFGGQIEVAAAELPYHQWRLHAAIEPLVAQDLPSGAPDQGTASPLVGQPAPEIALDLLAGGSFQLSKCKGQIVVLDFWATWCGPCMQTMPLVEEALREFDPQQVRLVSVNLEEPAAHVQSVIERHKLQVEVALDVDGVAARRYEANAIPQLVVVDKEGNIAKLYVGGGPQMVEQLKAALTELLNPPGTPPAAEQANP